MNKRSICRRWMVFAAVVLVLPLGGCIGPATVHYRHLMNFRVNHDGGGGPGPAPYFDMFEVYQVFRIENKESGAKDFAFSPDKLRLKNTGESALATMDELFPQSKGLFKDPSKGHGASIVVPAGTEQHLPELLYFLIMRCVGCGQEGGNAKGLQYTSSTGESVLMTRDGKEAAPTYIDSMDATTWNAQYSQWVSLPP